MRMMRHTLLIILMLTMTSLVFGQDQEVKPKKPFKDRLVFGGGVSLNFGTNYTLLGASPTIGYKVTDRYLAGIGVSYLYLDGNGYSLHNYAGSIFNRFAVIDELYLHAELELGTSKVTYNVPGDDIKQTLTYPALLVGAGYRQMAGGNVSIGFTILYDVIQDPNSPYNGIIYRGGLMVGF